MREERRDRDGGVVDWPSQLVRILEEVGRELGISSDRLSQQHVAAHLGISKGKLQAWLRGQRPSTGDMEHLARTMGFSPRWLLLGEGRACCGGGRCVGEGDRDIVERITLALERLQNRHGLTFSQLCAQLDMDEEMVLDMRDAGNRPDLEMLRSMRERFGVDLNWLVAGKGHWLVREVGGAGLDCGAVHEEHACQTSYKDPMVQRMEAVTRILKEAGADRTTIRKAVMAVVGAA